MSSNTSYKRQEFIFNINYKQTKKNGTIIMSLGGMSELHAVSCLLIAASPRENHEGYPL